MRKQIFGRRLKRDTNERKALFRSLMHGMVLQGRIRTTEAKAKSIKAELEKLVTHARKGDESARRLLISRLANEKVADRMISEIAPKFAKRPGGYTRIIKMGPRVKDGARMVLMTWVEEVTPVSFKETKRNKNIKPKTENKKETKTQLQSSEKISKSKSAAKKVKSKK